MTIPPLTLRQRQIVNFFEKYTRQKGISPTLEEIAQSMGVHKVTIFGHVGELERKGVLSRAGRGVSRGLTLVPSTYRAIPTSRPGPLPILGTIAAGHPLEAVEDPEEFHIDGLLPRGTDVFALRVRGNSMIEDSICDGDIVIVERRTQARNGETVVAVLPGHEATLKRFYMEGQRVRLQPANANLEPLYPAAVDIRGVVLAVIRRL